MMPGPNPLTPSGKAVSAVKSHTFKASALDSPPVGMLLDMFVGVICLSWIRVIVRRYVANDKN